ncbi:MAG: Crp/Fnr family transcriptional regulator [Cetobacterium sp.]|uniref:Crp/Fnr family transcriptional regulator n=1 Tax=Cetobacterium TaxID=180162 RepID=UPI001F051C84|nr:MULTISPECIES: Crp/Fnr family transcriptional regulator [Cetobacterium]MCX3068579.1 Crp/Fnr family transcriptional regulator [Cetobacterium somerae]UPO97220.1 Crp/Fnr family transcriptional regulator [Cetobacterium somerae]
MDFKTLVKFKLFKGISEDELENLFGKIKYEIKKFKKNDVVFFRDEKVDGLFIVIMGLLSAEMLKSNGDVQKIENLSNGDIIGSAFIFGEDNNLPVDLIVLEEGMLLHIDKNNLLQAFNTNEKFLINFLDEISDKTQFLSNKVWKSFNNKTIKEKVLDYILENTQNNKVIFKHSIKELAELFGVSRPSLSRVISEFVEEEILRRDGKNKFILNKEKI